MAKPRRVTLRTYQVGFGDCFGGSGLAVQTNAGLAPVVPLTGFNALGGFGLNERRDDVVFAGGGQIGYNFQFTPGSGFVIGLEADIQYADFNRRDDDDNFFGFGGFGGFGGGRQRCDGQRGPVQSGPTRPWPGHRPA